MDLRNRKTGESGYYPITHRDHDSGRVKIAVVKDGHTYSEFGTFEGVYDYDTLEQLNEDWEDYEGPEELYYLDENGTVCRKRLVDVDNTATIKEIGNCFKTRKEAERAVEKLMAWKRLRDKGFKFKGWHELGHRASVLEGADNVVRFDGEYDENDLDLLFGGEK